MAALAVAFGPSFGWLWTRWFPAWGQTDLGLYDRFFEGDSYYTHGPLVALVSLGIGLRIVRRVKIPIEPRRLAGLAVLAVSLLVHVAACLITVYFIRWLAFIGVLAGLVLYFWGGKALRRLSLPIAFLVFMVPLPGAIISELNFRLKMVATSWGVQLVRWLGIPAVDSGARIFLTEQKALVIGDVCSGLQTLISLLAFGAIYAYLCRLRGLWRLGLFAMTAPVAIVSNVIRISSVILVAHFWNVPAATGWYHDLSGLFIFLLAFLLMFSLEELILWARRAVGKPAEILPMYHDARRGAEDRGQMVRMALAAGGRGGWAAGIIIALAATCALALDRGRAVRPVWQGNMAKDCIPDKLRINGTQLHGKDLALDDHTLTILRTRDYLYRRYLPLGPGAAPVEICVVYSQSTPESTHPPEWCLKGGGNTIVMGENIVLPDVEGHGELPCRELVVRRGADMHYFLFTYKCGKRYSDTYGRQQFLYFTANRLGRRVGVALVRVSTPVHDNLDEARRKAAGLLRAAVPHLDTRLP